MGGFGFGGLGCGRGCDDRWRGGGWGGGCGGGCGGWDGGCGRGCGNVRSISVITAVRAVCARGDGCFDGGW